MLSKNGTYFDRELAVEGHYILTGFTNDHFVSDCLQITDLETELHRYLTEEAEFEAVFFLDPEKILWCMDQKSFLILQGLPLQQAPASAPAPRPRPGGQPAPAPRQNTRLNLGRMSMAAAWLQVSAVLQQENRRCALILTNANLMQGGEALMNTLTSFSASNHSIVISIFRDLNPANMSQWSTFARSVLVPKMDCDDPMKNRVISLGPPNRYEVENLLNALDKEPEFRLPMNKGQLEELGRELAASAARKNWSLVQLMNRLLVHSRKNPDLELNTDTWMDFTEESGYVPPMEELERMVGQEALKANMREWCDAQQQLQPDDSREPRRSSRLWPVGAASRSHRLGHKLNLELKGGAGMGKSTFAGIIARLYYDLGLLPRCHVVSRSRSQLLSPYPNQTAINTAQAIREALGGTLFIDEFHGLLTADPTGRDELLIQLANDLCQYEGQLSVIVAGYPEEMDATMDLNPKLHGCFPEEYTLEEYSAGEMQEIFHRMVSADPDGVTLSPEFSALEADFFSNWVGGRTATWNNAREAQNLLVDMKKRAQTRQNREGSLSGGLMLTPNDIPGTLQHCTRPVAKSVEEALQRMDGLIGLRNVKKYLRSLAKRILVGTGEREPLNFIFAGPAGAGKTTTAACFAEVLGLLGVLRRKSNNLVTVTAGQLTNGTMTVDRLIRQGRGAMILVDEAHQLTQSPEGRAVIRSLVPLIADPEISADTCFVMAGYGHAMQKFLEVDEGLPRRFPKQNRIRFLDYTAGELTRILEEKARRQGQIPTEEFLLRCRMALTEYMKTRPANFGNGGFIADDFLPSCVNARAQRLSRKATGSDAVPTQTQVRLLTDGERRTFTAQDLPDNYQAMAGPMDRFVPEEAGALAQIEALVEKEKIVDFARAVCGQEGELFTDSNRTHGLHYAITGPTGVGKHTSVSALSHLFAEKELLETDYVTWISEAALIAGYVGQTSDRAQALVDQAVGGTLAVLAPSSMLPKNQNDNSFGPQALAVLQTAMGRDDLCVVLLDTPEGLQALYQSFPGFRSCVSATFELEDLSPQAMYRIFRAKTDDCFAFDPAIEEVLPDFFLNWVSDRGGLGAGRRSWGNGAEVDKLLTELTTNWKNADGAVATTSITENGRTYRLRRRQITLAHWPKELRKYLKKTTAVADTAMAELMALPGLQKVKEAVEQVRRRVVNSKNPKPGCYLLMGFSGVGKTTVARLFGGVLKAAGALRQGHVILKTAREMMEQLADFDSILKLAKDGILAIDEAHELADYTLGREVLNRLLTVLEDDNITANTCILLCGYPAHMLHMLKTDQGFASRFGQDDQHILFENYSPQELEQILHHMASRANTIPAIGTDEPLTLSEEFVSGCRGIFRAVVAKGDPTYGNARFVRNLLHDAVNEQLARFERSYGSAGVPADVRWVLTGEDIPKAMSRMAAKQQPRLQLKPSDLSTAAVCPVTDSSYLEACRQLSASTVFIQVNKNGQDLGSGSGTILTSSGLVLTCQHVIEGAEEIRVRIHTPGAIGGDYLWVNAQVLDPVRKDCDMALLQLEGKNFPCAGLRPKDEPSVPGERILILGYPLGATLADKKDLNISNFDGRIASPQVKDGIERVYIDCKGLHGNSGSPVFDSRGRVAGVFAGSIVPDKEHSLDELNYFYPIHYFWEHFVKEVN